MAKSIARTIDKNYLQTNIHILCVSHYTSRRGSCLGLGLNFNFQLKRFTLL